VPIITNGNSVFEAKHNPATGAFSRREFTLGAGVSCGESFGCPALAMRHPQANGLGSLRKRSCVDLFLSYQLRLFDFTHPNQ
jgi:hypothetical protein